MADGKDVVYAIEEPETSQHNEHIKMMMDALKTLSGRNHIQIIVTTHSPYLVKQLEYSQLRLVDNDTNVKRAKPVDTASMPYVSLNEVNFLAFGEVSEEYHDELYGHLEYRGDISTYFATQPKENYQRILRDGTPKTEQKCKTEVIRHQIYHPENTLNARYSPLVLDATVFDK